MGAGLGRGRRAARRSIEGLCITRAGLCFSSWIFSNPNPNRAQPGSDLRFEPWTFHSPNQPAPPSLSFGLVRVGPCLQCTGPSVFPIRSQAVWKYFSKSHSVKSHSFLSFIHDIPHYTKIMKGSRAFGLQQNRTVCWKIFYKSFKL